MQERVSKVFRIFNIFDLFFIYFKNGFNFYNFWHLKIKLCIEFYLKNFQNIAFSVVMVFANFLHINNICLAYRTLWSTLYFCTLVQCTVLDSVIYNFYLLKNVQSNIIFCIVPSLPPPRSKVCLRGLCTVAFQTRFSTIVKIGDF